MYGKSGDAVANVIASYQLAYPGEAYEALKRGAEWTIRLAADEAATNRHFSLPHEEQMRKLEEIMFGPGDHSSKRATPPAGA